MFQRSSNNEKLYIEQKTFNVTRLKQNESLTMVLNLFCDPKLLGLGDVALFDEEIIDFTCLVDVNLDQCSGLCQPQPTLSSALVK